MKALLCKSLDGPDALVVDDIAEPIPGAGEIAIEVKAVALNFFDTLITRGKYQFKPPLPFSPGGEVAGIVKSVGADVDGFAVGQRVAAYIGWNGCCQVIVAPAASVIPIPASVTDEAAASLPIAYGTALHGLTDRGKLRAGETVLVLGATGGTGLAAVEIAVAMGGIVIAAGTSDDKLKICAERGAYRVLNVNGLDLKTALRDMTEGRGVDMIYDCIGGHYAEPALRAMAWGGRYLVVGFAAGDIPKIPLNLLLLKGCEMIGVFWGRHAEKNPAAVRSQMAQLYAWCAEGKIRPHIDRIARMEDAAEVLKLMEKREIKGKAVICVES